MAASVNISEDDFKALASAAQRAQDDGALEEARTLDRLARKVNAALSNAKYRSLANSAGFAHTPIRWTGVPSTLL